MNSAQLLTWYVEMGVDEAVEEAPINRLAPPAPPPPPLPEPDIDMKRAKAPTLPSEAAKAARQLADNADTREELEKAVRGFDGCSLKKTATNTVFSDGNPKARVMVIGEAPGAQEDVQGIPFCGPSGKLLDRMLASIGLSRQENTYITNTVFWRPPGNRAPTPEELAICEPFLQKHIALQNPALLILSGGVAATAVLKTGESVGKMRKQVHMYENPYTRKPIPTVVTFHPSYLMRSPGQKKTAWYDWLMIQEFLEEHGIAA